MNISKHIDFLFKDTLGELFFLGRKTRLLIIYVLYTVWSYIILTLKRVSLGKSCRFNGFPYMYRYPGSKIKIGCNCLFTSNRYSNLIGVNRKCIISTHSEEAIIEIGNNCGLSGVSIGATKLITLGNNVRCGANVVITDFDWHDEDPRTNDARPVIIEDDVWLGMDVIVLKGVTIGRNTIIGAGSVVTRDIKPNMIAAGNPCKEIKPVE